MSRLQYEYNVGGLLEFYPPEGVPTSGSVTCYSSGFTAIIGPDAIVLDTASQNIATGAEGSRNVTVASTANFKAGRRYIVAIATGRCAEVVVVEVTSGTVLLLESPLRFTATGGTIKGHGLRRTLSAAEAATQRRRVRILWSYVVDGVTYRKQDLFDVVYWPFALDASEEEINRADLYFSEQVGRYDAWKRCKIMAFNDVWQHLEGSQIVPDLVRSRDLLQTAYVYRVLYHRHFVDEVRRTHFKTLYDEAFAHFYQSRNAWYDTDDDLVASQDGWTTQYVGTSPIWVKSEGGDETHGVPESNRLRIT